MDQFNASQVLKDMFEAARASLGSKFPETLTYVEKELKKLGTEIFKVETQLVMGEIDSESAKIIINSIVNSAKTVEITRIGIAKVEAEKAINAALAVLVKAIKAVA